MSAVLKAACLLAYALALAALVGRLPPLAGAAVEALAAGLLVIHALELGFVLRVLREDRPRFAANLVLSLLFGMLHWKPLMERSAEANQTR